MFAPFFALAANSPARQETFRRLVAANLLLYGVAAFALWGTVEAARAAGHAAPSDAAVPLGNLALVAGIVTGALLLGWRLSQLPKSPWLEFLLVSPLRPFWLFLAEASVGLVQLLLATLAPLPVLVLLVTLGYLGWADLAPLLTLPLVWGAVCGLGFTAWAYEPRKVRRWGERVMVVAVLLYLVVGILAAEKLGEWLAFTPPGF